MRITPDHPNFETTLVYLDDKLCRSYLAADDEEGWIDVPDISSMAPINLTESGASKANQPINVEPWTEVPVKRKEGKVEFRPLPKRK